MDTGIEKHYEAKIFGEVHDFIKRLSSPDRAKVAANITMLEKGQFGSVHTKSLRNAIKELIVKNYRFIFFIHKNLLYFISAFTKKTQKTPKQEIDNAEKIYKDFIKDK